MKLYFDREADALFLEFRPIKEGGGAGTKHVAPNINLLVDSDGNALAIEVLNLTQLAGQPVLEHLEMDLAPPFGREGFDVDLPPEVEAWLKQQKGLKEKARTRA